MLVPKITSTLTLDPSLQQALSLLPFTLYTDEQQAVASIESGYASAWADIASAAQAKDLLNSGLSVAVLAPTQLDATIDTSRIAFRYSAADVAAHGLKSIVECAIAEGVQRAGAVVLELTADQINEATLLADGGKPLLVQLVNAASAKLLGTDGPVRVLVELVGDGSWTIGMLSRLAGAGADAV
ncbi:hypothetical protein GGF47_006279, partial [Coemansia sp. RSA 2524]